MLIYHVYEAFTAAKVKVGELVWEHSIKGKRKMFLLKIRE